MFGPRNSDSRQMAGTAITLSLLVLFALGARPLNALELPTMKAGPHFSTGKDQYYRYELVDLSLDGTTLPFSGKEFPNLEVRFLFAGKEVRGLPGREHAVLIWDESREAWRGNWPVPWNPKLGEYTAEVLAPDANAAPGKIFGGPAGDWEVHSSLTAAPLAQAVFTIRGRKPIDLPPGFSVMTLEPGSNPYSSFPGVDGEKPSWYRLLEWAHFMQADAFWHAAGQTQVWGPLNSSNFPWDQDHLKMARQFAAESKLQGIGFGAYMITFMVEGDFQKTGYTFTTGYEHSINSLVNLRFISMGDPKRHQDLVNLVREFDGMDGVSWIGFDYVRDDTGCLEFIDEFISDMNYQLSPTMKNGSLKDRQMWLGYLLSVHSGGSLEAEWDWWRAHKVATVMKSILDDAKPKKPVFVFSLGWKRGHQHGQDPRMFIDAGVSFNTPMFYQVNSDQFRILLEDWKNYVNGMGGTYVFGQPVDTPLLANDRGLNGPEELYQRQVDTINTLFPLADHVGLFFHDINRAMGGGRGPESMREWAIAGAAAFSRLRESAGTVPIRAEILEGAAETPLGITFSVRITNLTKEKIPLLRLDGVRVSGIVDYQPSSLDVPRLKPFEIRELNWVATKGPRIVKARFQGITPDNRMLAVRARVLGSDEWKRPSFAFKYVGPRELPQKITETAK
jgi:hypothetical protein